MCIRDRIGLDVNLARDFEVTQKNCRKATDSYHHSFLLKKCLFLYTMDIIDSQTNLSETQTNVGNEHSWSSYPPNRVKLPLPSRWILCPGKSARKSNSDQYCTRSWLHQLKDMLNSSTLVPYAQFNPIHSQLGTRRLPFMRLTRSILIEMIKHHTGF